MEKDALHTVFCFSQQGHIKSKYFCNVINY